MMELIYVSMINLMVLVGVSFLVLMERKVLGLLQIRKGPNKSFMLGFVQSLLDAMKLFMKSFMKPAKSYGSMFMISPVLMLLISLMMWMVVPYGGGIIDLEMSLIFFLVLLSLGAYPFILSGWSSNSKYSFLGSMRAVAQVISYEISLVMLVMCLCMSAGSYSLGVIMDFQMNMPLLFVYNFLGVILLLSLLAEMNRTPFDFSEGESELVSGYNVEFGGILFTMMFLSEYANILVMSGVMSMLFMGYVGFNIMFFFFLNLVSLMIVLVRGLLPRYRYDLLMNLAWKKILPVSLGVYMMTVVFSVI